MFPWLLLAERSSLPKGWEGEGVGFECDYIHFLKSGYKKVDIEKVLGVGTTTTPIEKKECKSANKSETLENKGFEGNSRECK